jgi:hypothetical protein
LSSLGESFSSSPVDTSSLRPNILCVTGNNFIHTTPDFSNLKDTRFFLRILV